MDFLSVAVLMNRGRVIVKLDVAPWLLRQENGRIKEVSGFLDDPHAEWK